MNKLSFEAVALETFPELTDRITRKQVNEIIAKNPGVRYPVHITNPINTIVRGIFNFNAHLAIGGSVEREPVVIESDEEMKERILERYESMEIFIKAVADNTVNSLIIAGGAGLGKSYTVNKVLHQVSGGQYGYVFHRGYLRATHLFRLLYENRQKGQTIVIDDCDTIFSDEIALNLLKAALELKDSRLIGWGSEKQFVDEDGENIPRYFDYEGSVIFLTNLAFSEMANSGSKYGPHLIALESRSLVLDLLIKSKREYMTKIFLTVQKDGMLRDKGLSIDEENLILNFMTENVDRLKELSLRMCEKIAALYLMDKVNWVKLARTVTLR